jgi:hypothetical protein
MRCLCDTHIQTGCALGHFPTDVATLLMATSAQSLCPSAVICQCVLLEPLQGQPSKDQEPLQVQADTSARAPWREGEGRPANERPVAANGDCLAQIESKLSLSARVDEKMPMPTRLANDGSGQTCGVSSRAEPG